MQIYCTLILAARSELEGYGEEGRSRRKRGGGEGDEDRRKWKKGRREEKREWRTVKRTGLFIINGVM